VVQAALRRGIQSPDTADGANRALLLLGLPAAAGNSAAQRLLSPERDVVVQRQEHHPAGGTQLHLPQLGESLPSTASPGPTLTLRTDPRIEAQANAARMVQELLSPDPVLTALAQLPLPSIPPDILANLTDDPPASARPGRGTPPGPLPTHGLGTGSDIWRVLFADPALGRPLQQLQERALARLARSAAELTPAQWLVATTAAIATTGVPVVGVLGHPAVRDWALANVIGRLWPIPGIRGLHLQLQILKDNTVVGFHLDLSHYLPSPLGFGTGAPTPLNQPPNPYLDGPMQH
jgi:hypothetical protein